jgi:hypothetical protein
MRADCAPQRAGCALSAQLGACHHEDCDAKTSDNRINRIIFRDLHNLAAHNRWTIAQIA